MVIRYIDHLLSVDGQFLRTIRNVSQQSQAERFTNVPCFYAKNIADQKLMRKFIGRDAGCPQSVWTFDIEAAHFSPTVQPPSGETIDYARQHSDDELPP